MDKQEVMSVRQDLENLNGMDGIHILGYIPLAEALLAKGYRKIPEGARIFIPDGQIVVLSREEYDELQKGVQTRNYTAMFQAQDAYSWEQGYFLARKETAEKFAERLLHKDNIFEEKDNSYLFYKEEIDEICKEITGKN
jgi:hypothetical protein